MPAVLHKSIPEPQPTSVNGRGERIIPWKSIIWSSARFTGPGLHPLSGSNYTVKAVGREFGPSERATWNFANFDESTLNLVTGESGIFLSRYYMDQWPAWYGGTTFPFPFSHAAVEQHRAHEMTLAPR